MFLGLPDPHPDPLVRIRFHHQDGKSYPDPHPGENSDLDAHQSKKSGPDPHDKENSDPDTNPYHCVIRVRTRNTA